MFFGQFLVRNSIITPDELEKGLVLQKELNKPIGETLVHMGLIEKDRLHEYLDAHILNCADDIVNDPQFKEYLSQSV